MTTLDGTHVFGDSVSVVDTRHSPVSNGGTFIVTGVLSAASLRALNLAEERLLSYADGEEHVLTDGDVDRGFAVSIVFRGEYTPAPSGPRPLAGGGWCLPYRMVLEAAV